MDDADFCPKLFDVRSLTFDEGQRATAPEFTVAIPDGWRVFYAREEGERAFRAYADDAVTWDVIDDAGEYAYDGLFYCPMSSPMPEENKAGLRDHGIDEFVRAFRRMVRDGDANPMAKRNKCFDIVRGKNCYVMVIDDRPYDGGYCVQICPCMPFSSSYVRLNCPNQGNADKDAAFAKAIEIAKTVELAEPLVCDVLAAVEKSGREKVSADEFVGAAAGLINTIDAARNLEREPVSQRFLREAKRDLAAGAVTFEEVKGRNHQVMLDYFSDFSERIIHYMFDLLDAYGFQKSSGSSPDELREMVGVINDGMALFDFRLTADDPAERAAIDALGNVRKPADWPRLRAMVDEEMGALGMGVPEVPPTPDAPVDKEATAEPRALDLISAGLPEQLVDCLEMCLRNVVGFEFYERVFEQLKGLALEELDAAGCEASCWLAVEALRAQAFKGALPEELELMRLEAESVAVELNAAHGFDLRGTILAEAQKSSVEELAAGRMRQAVGTRLVDALSMARWKPVMQLVDVLIEVVNAKSRTEYAEALSTWEEEKEELDDASAKARARLDEARDAYADAQKSWDDLAHRIDALEDLIADVVEFDRKIGCIDGDLNRLLAGISDKKSKLDALSPRSFIQKSRLQKEINDNGAAAAQKRRKRGEFSTARAERLDSFGEGPMTLDEARALKEDLERDLPRMTDEVAALCSRRSEAEGAAEEAGLLARRHAAQKPDEDSFAHKNLGRLAWRPSIVSWRARTS